MDPVKIIRLKESILADNDADAEELRRQTKDAGLCYVNLMSSPGSGKTSTILALIEELKKRGAVAAPASTAVGQTGTSAADSRDAASEQPESPLSIGVMEADIDSDVDAQTIQDKAGVPAVQLHTGGMCHLDAEMSRQGLRALGIPIVSRATSILTMPSRQRHFDLVIYRQSRLPRGGGRRIEHEHGDPLDPRGRRQAAQVSARLHEVRCRHYQQNRRAPRL